MMGHGGGWCLGGGSKGKDAVRTEVGGVPGGEGDRQQDRRRPSGERLLEGSVSPQNRREKREDAGEEQQLEMGGDTERPHTSLNP